MGLEGNSDYDVLTDRELTLAKSFFEIWSKQLKRLEEQRNLKVPQRVQWLPCECQRERGYEGDPNSSWTIVKSGSGFSLE